FGTSSNAIITTSSNITCLERERQSLLVFKRNLTDTYDLLSTWSGLECCEWHGVGCDSRDGHVVKLDLHNKWLTGELSPSLQNLKHLRYLDLSLNNISGYIPEFLGSFQYLEYLNFSGSSFVGVVPHNLGHLSRLQYLDLSNVESLKLDDLGWLSSLSSLRYLDLSTITIGKHIDWFRPVNMLPSLLTLNLAYCGINIPSTNFANLTSLSSLDLSFNELNFTIPAWLSNLTSLMHLNLEFNHFHGQIPIFFGTFSALASIDLSSNSLETSMPVLLCNLSSLVRLDLSWNMFSGPIPANLGLLLKLEDINFQYNRLSGYIPTSLGQLSNLKKLDLSHNSLVGVLSETHFTKLENLNYLVLSSNSLALNLSSRWIAPFQLQIFSASSCNIGPHFPNWLQTQTNLQRLTLSNSSIRDTIPEWFENTLSHILYLDLSNNQIGGKLPRLHFNSSSQIGGGILKMNSNKFEGSVAMFPSNVKLLDLSDNLLSVDILHTFRKINSSLEVVNLSKNRFTGSIPVHLCKFPSIYVLDLSHNKFSGMLPGCLGNLTNLSVLDVSNNTITGVVPSSLGSLKGLISLHLHNNIFEGDIPVSLQNLTQLMTMDLGNNLFMGAIPLWIGEKLSNLRILNLQSNKFIGKIPRRLCQLSALQYLSLAHNNINGTIPDCFRNLSGMITASREYIVLNYNENILASIKGMELLYTNTIHCNVNNVARNHVGENGEDEGQDDTEGLWFYVSMGLGFVVGFTGLLGSQFIRSWRIAYFETLENVYGWLTATIQKNLAGLRRKLSN
ncbi:hypothetical protein M8C21_029679, partial [Ambrosia artemisiifolia]